MKELRMYWKSGFKSECSRQQNTSLLFKLFSCYHITCGIVTMVYRKFFLTKQD